MARHLASPSQLLEPGLLNRTPVRCALCDRYIATFVGLPVIMNAPRNIIEFVHPQQTLSIKLDEIPYRTFYSKVAEIGPELKYTPKQVSSRSGGDLIEQGFGPGVCNCGGRLRQIPGAGTRRL